MSSSPPARPVVRPVQRPVAALVLACVVALLGACGAGTIKVAPVTVEPIHVTVDVNLHDGTANPAPTPGAAKR